MSGTEKDYENMTEPEKLKYLFDQDRKKKNEQAAKEQKAAGSDPFQKVLDKYGSQDRQKEKADPFSNILAKYHSLCKDGTIFDE